MFPEPRPALGIKNVEVKQRCARRRWALAGAGGTRMALFAGRRYAAAGREEMMVLEFDINAGGRRAGSPPLRRSVP
jgi:hypothetical protein